MHCLAGIMTYLWPELASGLISGLLATAIIVLFIYSLRTTILPWIDNVAYRGTRVDGTWLLIADAAASRDMKYAQTETLVLKQQAMQVLGQLTLIARDKPKAPATTFDVQGIVRDGFITITSSSKGLTYLGFQAFAGKVSPTGDEITGYASYHDTTHDKVQMVKATYKKQPKT